MRCVSVSGASWTIWRCTIGAMVIQKNGTTYYLSGNTWFQPMFGANGVHYLVVQAP